MRKRVTKRTVVVVDRKATGLRTWTRDVIDAMMKLNVFTVKELQKKTSWVALRRINDVVAILSGAAFISKGPGKKQFTFVGIEGTRRLFHQFKEGTAPEFVKKSRINQHYGWLMVQLLSVQDKWNQLDLRTELCMEEKHVRRTYDTVAVFLGAHLLKSLDGDDKIVVSTIFQPPPPPSAVVAPVPVVQHVCCNCRKILNVSDEDAIAILPELEQHLMMGDGNNNTNDAFIF